MEKEIQPLAGLAKRLNLTDPEKEEFILTEAEITTAVLNAIEARKKHKAWKWVEAGFSEQEVLLRLSQVDWEKEVNQQAVIDRANSNKHQDLWHQEQRRIEKENELKKFKELSARCDAKYMFKLMKWSSLNEHGKELILNEHNKHFIVTLCYFLSNDARFETELGYSFKKGLLIRGISGLGKTHLVKCVQDNELNPILILSMLEINDEIKEQGEYEIRLGNRKMIYLDDVGTEEPTVNHYGTKISFFKNFIELVYLKNQNKTFNKLLISTNNSFAEIETKYGFRVRSRVKDMFNIIDVKGEDMRG